MRQALGMDATLRYSYQRLGDLYRGQAIEELTRDRGVMSPAQANREVYRLVKDGVKVTANAKTGSGKRQTKKSVTVKVIDWENPKNKDFFLASQGCRGRCISGGQIWSGYPI